MFGGTSQGSEEPGGLRAQSRTEGYVKKGRRRGNGGGGWQTKVLQKLGMLNKSYTKTGQH